MTSISPREFRITSDRQTDRQMLNSQGPKKEEMDGSYLHCSAEMSSVCVQEPPVRGLSPNLWFMIQKFSSARD